MKKQIELFIKKLKEKDGSATFLICSQNPKKEKELAILTAELIVRAGNKGSIKNNPDIFSIERGDSLSIGIDKVHEFIRIGQLKPFASDFKVGIIYEAHKMTKEAQNALLKMAEEPPKNTFLILTCPKPSFLIPTLISRCKIFEFQGENDNKISELDPKRILSLNLLDRFKLVEKLSATKDKSILRESVNTLLNNLLRYFRLTFLRERKSANEVIKSLELIELTQRAIEGNVNTRLAMENLFINLPVIK